MSEPGARALLASALSGLRVLDLSQGIAGPSCTSILQQQGAEVIKLEPPGGDWARKAGRASGGFTAPVIAFNAGKRGVCLDLRLPGAVAAARRLAAMCDVVVQNFRPGVAARLGLGPDFLCRSDPRLVYLSINGFGSDGPLVDLPATDSVMQSMTGMMVANGDADGRPRKIGLYLADLATAVYAAQMVTAALFVRERGGRGAQLEVSLLEACAAFQSSHIVESAMSAEPPAPSSAPNGVFACSDGGFLSIATANDRMFQGLCDALERPEWKRDARLAGMAGRLAHGQELNDATAVSLAGRPVHWWLDRLRKHDVLCSKVSSYRDLVADPQVVQQRVFAQLDQPGFGPLPFARAPGTHDGRPVAAAPRLGEHNEPVLREAGFSDEELAALRAEGALVDPA